jgi:hypothetical protein
VEVRAEVTYACAMMLSIYRENLSGAPWVELKIEQGQSTFIVARTLIGKGRVTLTPST